MKKVDTLRQLIREAVLAEMGDMWQYGRHGEDRVGVVIDRDYVNTVYFKGTPAECQEFIEKNYADAPQIYMGKDVITYKVVGPPRGSSDYLTTIKDWLEGKEVPNKVIDAALGSWFTRDLRRPAVVLMKWAGGPVVMGYPIPESERVPGGDRFERESFELDRLAKMIGLDHDRRG